MPRYQSLDTAEIVKAVAHVQVSAKDSPIEGLILTLQPPIELRTSGHTRSSLWVPFPSC